MQTCCLELLKWNRAIDKLFIKHISAYLPLLTYSLFGAGCTTRNEQSDLEEDSDKHQKGNCSGEDASSAGGHGDPTMKPHGQRSAGDACHKGDVGNMEVGQDRRGTLSLVEGWRIGGADNTNVVEKSMIVNDKADDFVLQPAGNAGSWISCVLSNCLLNNFF